MSNIVKNNFVCLTVIVFVVFSCGGGSPTDESDVIVSQYTTSKDYPAGALAKMKSLGTTVEGEKTVTVDGTDYATNYNVKIYANGRCTSYGYTFFTVRRKSYFKAIVKDLEKSKSFKDDLVEVNHADLYYCMKYSSWQTDLDTNKRFDLRPGQGNLR